MVLHEHLCLRCTVGFRWLGSAHRARVWQMIKVPKENVDARMTCDCLLPVTVLTASELTLVTKIKYRRAVQSPGGKSEPGEGPCLSAALALPSSLGHCGLGPLPPICQGVMWLGPPFPVQLPSWEERGRKSTGQADHGSTWVHANLRTWWEVHLFVWNAWSLLISHSWRPSFFPALGRRSDIHIQTFLGF